MVGRTDWSTRPGARAARLATTRPWAGALPAHPLRAVRGFHLDRTSMEAHQPAGLGPSTRAAIELASTAMSSRRQQISSHLTARVLAMFLKTFPAKIGSRCISATSVSRGITRNATPSLSATYLAPGGSGGLRGGLREFAEGSSRLQEAPGGLRRRPPEGPMKVCRRPGGAPRRPAERPRPSDVSMHA